MAAFIALILPLLTFVIALLVLYRINKRTHIFQHPRSLPWLYVVAIVSYTAFAWLNFVIRISVWGVVLFVAASALFADILLMSIIDRRRWVRYLWKPAPRSFSHDRRLCLIALTVALIALASDAVLLILLIAR